jgi:hypothetical protein
MLMTMKVKLRTSAALLVWLFLASACGQQTVPPPRQASATQKKGQIAQPEVKPGKAADASSLLITFHGCADLVLSDPRGRKLGYDAAARKNYQQIPGGIYDEGDLISDDEGDVSPAKPEAKPAKPETKTPAAGQGCASDKTVQVPHPLAGGYILSIDNSTGNPFKLEITSYGAESKQNGHFAVSQAPAGPSASAYQFQLPPSPGGVLEVKTR